MAFLKTTKYFVKIKNWAWPPGKIAKLTSRNHTKKVARTWNFQKNWPLPKKVETQKNRNWENWNVSKHLESIKKMSKFSKKVKIVTFLKVGLFEKLIFLILSTFFDTLEWFEFWLFWVSVFFDNFKFFWKLRLFWVSIFFMKISSFGNFWKFWLFMDISILNALWNMRYKQSHDASANAQTYAPLHCSNRTLPITHLPGATSNQLLRTTCACWYWQRWDPKIIVRT